MTKNTMLKIPTMTCQYFEEPLLCFGDEKQHIDPKTGILRYGPKSYSPRKRHPSTVKVGFIGSAETIEIVQKWLEESSEGVEGDLDHPEFPGYQKDRGFFSELEFDQDWIAQLNRSEINEVLKIKSESERFEYIIQLLESKLDVLSRKDFPPQYIIIALPDKVIKKCRVADYQDSQGGQIHRDLRRAFKSIAMKYRIPTQLLTLKTVDGRDKDHPSKIAWNFFTGLYFKAGGFPWTPIGLQAGTCYIGISFYRSINSASSNVQTSLVQAFDEHGEGLVLRGPNFIWDSNKEGTKSPHLPEEQANQLIDLVLNQYREEMGQIPKRVVVHKTSRYYSEERNGFETALQKYSVHQFDLVALTPQSTVRLLIANKYPPLRGTRFTVGDIDYLYTTGFIAQLKQFHGMHVPSPIQIADHIGYDSPREMILKDILILTKMNWNSSRLGGLLPITLKFAKLVGDVMKEIPDDREPLSNFKFYM